MKSSSGGVSAPDPYRLTDYFGFDPAIPGTPIRAISTVPPPARVVVDPRLVGGQSTAVIVVIGQSGGSSCVNTTHTPVNSLVHTLDITSGLVTQAKDILPGDTFNPTVALNSASNLFSRVADTLITDGKYARVILVPMAVSGSSYGHWASGGPANPVYGDRGYIRHRFGVVGRRLSDKGYTPTLICWVHGVTDANAGNSQANCVTAMQSMIGDMNALGWTCPIWMSKETWAFGSQLAGAPAIRAAIDQIIAGSNQVHLGPDQDVLDNSNRYDGSHWNSTGAAAAAARWVTSLEA